MLPCFVNDFGNLRHVVLQLYFHLPHCHGNIGYSCNVEIQEVKKLFKKITFPFVENQEYELMTGIYIWSGNSEVSEHFSRLYKLIAYAHWNYSVSQKSFSIHLYVGICF